MTSPRQRHRTFVTHALPSQARLTVVQEQDTTERISDMEVRLKNPDPLHHRDWNRCVRGEEKLLRTGRVAFAPGQHNTMQTP